MTLPTASSYVGADSVQPMDEIRKRILSRMEELGSNPSRLSAQLGKNRAYMHQYLKGDQKDLPYEMKVKVAEILEMELEELGVKPITAQRPAKSAFEKDAEPYVPPRDHWLGRSPHIGFFRMKSTALDQHPERIKPGDLLAFDLNLSNPAAIPSGRIVVVQLYDKRDLTRSYGTIIRQFIAPNKLITNSSDGNEIISLDDTSLPYEPVIKGTLISVVRELK